jgi:hypothetical protein
MSAPEDPQEKVRVSPTEASQGRIIGQGAMVKVLGISLVLIVVAFAILYLFFVE